MEPFAYSFVRYPSIKQHGNKHLAFIDPSKAEEDKYCEEYLKEMTDLHRELSSSPKPYNLSDIQRSDLILTSMKDEVALKDTIQYLAKYQDEPISSMYLKEEQDQAEKRARRHYILFYDNLNGAYVKDEFYRRRPYISHGMFLKLLIILQLNPDTKVAYASQYMSAHGVMVILVYTILYVIVGVPIHFAMRALSQYSKCTVITMWNFCPFFKGTGFVTLIYAVLFLLRLTAESAILFCMFFDALRGYSSWDTCEKGLRCTSESNEYMRSLNCTAIRDKSLDWKYNTASGMVYLNTVLQNSFSGFEERLKWDGLFYLLAVWAVILFFMMLGFEKFIAVANRLFIPIVSIGVTILLAIICSAKDGTMIGMSEFLSLSDFSFSFLTDNFLLGSLFADVLVSNGLTNFISSHAPQNVDPMVDTYIFSIIDVATTYCVTIVVVYASGFLAQHYQTTNTGCFLFASEVTLQAAIPEYLSRARFGKLWLFLYILYSILTLIIVITTVAHMTVNSLTDTFEALSSSGNKSHSSLILLLVGCGFTYNIFFDFAKDVTKPDPNLKYCYNVIELVIALIFIVAVVIMYSSSGICRNVYLITGEKPSNYSEFLLKLGCFVTVVIGVNDLTKLHEKYQGLSTPKSTVILLFCFLPVIVYALTRMAFVYHTPNSTLFGVHPDWGASSLLTEMDPTRPRYDKPLICTHRCLRQYMYGHFDEQRLVSLRKCFAIVHARSLLDKIAE